MTTSPLTKRVLTFSLNQGLLVVVNKVGNIVKVFDVVQSIPFRCVPGLVNEIFNRVALTFFHYSLVKKIVYLKEFGGVGVTVDKHGGGHVRIAVMEEIIGWGGRWLQLSHWKYRIYLPIKRNI